MNLLMLTAVTINFLWAFLLGTFHYLAMTHSRFVLVIFLYFKGPYYHYQKSMFVIDLLKQNVQLTLLHKNQFNC